MSRMITRINRPITLSVAALGLLLLAAFAAFGPARPAHADEPAQGAFVAQANLVLQPNLVVQSTRFINFGDDVYLQFTVKNTGLANAGAFKMNVESANGAVVQSFASAGLAPGQTTVHAHKLPGCVPLGIVSRTIVADAGNLVAESNEGDNEVTKNYIYGPAC